MGILKQQIFQFTEDNATSLQEDFPASPSAQQEREKEQKITDTSGRKCLEQFGRFPLAGSWAKTFAGLLIGMEGWYSTVCRLTWKLKVTKCSRFYFQLAVSALHIEGIGYGLLHTPLAVYPPHWERKNSETDNEYWERVNQQDKKLNYKASTILLPTPTVMDTNQGDLEKVDQRRERAKSSKINGNGFGVTLGELANRGLLPTPRAAKIGGYSSQRFSPTLEQVVIKSLLPTPTGTSDAKGDCTRPNPKRQNDTLAHAMHAATNGETGRTSQLNPRFVEEMMSFPIGWTELKPSETP